MANQTKEEEDEETAMVIKYASWAGAVLVFAAAVVAIFALSLPWWSGTQSSKLLIQDSRLDGTETTMAASISLWTFDLQVQLAPREGERDGEVQNIRATWDDTCAQAARTLPQVPYCAEVTLARALVILAAILDSFSAAFVVLARRFSPLLLLAAVASGVLATLFCFGAAGLGVMTSTTGLGGMGYFLLGGSLMASGLAVGAIFYAAAKAMPPPPDALEEVRKTRMSNLQESTKKEREMAAILEENVQRRRRESEEMGMSPAQRGSIKRVPVMLQKVIFWTQENEDNEDAELPMELLQAAYQEIDEDGSGSVTLVELVDALKLCGLNASEAAATTVMQEIDKNMNGTIDIHEFVMFFRTLEEMTRFQRKTQQRAQFLSYVLNFCFLVHIILVGVLLMIFIRMDEETGGDTYPILRNCLMAFSIVLVVLFLLVIGIPAARMTLGVQVTAWQYHYTTAMRPDGKLKRQAAQRNADSTAGPRGAAWSEGAGRAPPSVNAAKYGASYRVSRMNYDGSAEAMLQQQQQQQMQMQMQQQRANSNAGLLTNRSETPTGSAIPSAIPTQRPQGAIMSKTGEFLRYDPAAYRNAAMNSMGARMPMSFTPMQVQNMQTSADDPGQPGTMAITDGGSNY